MEGDLKSLKKYIKTKKIYMIWGNGKKNQYSSIFELNKVITQISKELEKDCVLLYFGDISDKDNLDIGYVFTELNNKRNDIEIIMIQNINIKENNEYILPDFVSKVLWHTNNTKDNKLRGVNKNNNKPLGSTKTWLNIHNHNNIDCIYILGGGNTTLEEFNLAKSENINIKYYPLKRKFLGDGKTLLKKNATNNDKIGVTSIIYDSYITPE